MNINYKQCLPWHKPGNSRKNSNHLCFCSIPFPVAFVFISSDTEYILMLCLCMNYTGQNKHVELVLLRNKLEATSISSIISHFQHLFSCWSAVSDQPTPYYCLCYKIIMSNQLCKVWYKMMMFYTNYWKWINNKGGNNSNSINK